MTNFARKILPGTLWLGKGTATVMSLATPFALTVGLASTALAGAGMGARFAFSFAKAVPAGRTVRATATGAGALGVLCASHRDGAVENSAKRRGTGSRFRPSYRKE